MFSAIIMRGSLDTPQNLTTGNKLLQAMMPYSQADVTGFWQDERALIAQALWHNTPESMQEKTPEICKETGRVIAAWVRLDNRDALCVKLGLENDASLTDPQIILAMHHHFGKDCVNLLEGDFSFVIYSPAHNEVFCARDSIGTKPLFYVLTEEAVYIATSIVSFFAIPTLRLTKSMEWSARYLAVLTWDQTKTAYNEVKRLPPAHFMTVRADTVDSPFCYFKFDLQAPHASKRDGKWVTAYRDALHTAVARRTRSNFLIGAESSGGLDSSSIVAVLAGMLPHSREDFHCFGLCSSEKETSYILNTAAKADVRHNHITVRTPLFGGVDGVDRAIKVLGYPAENIQPLMHLSFYELSQHLGIRTLFSGFGGDEVVTNYADWLRWELWRRKDYRALLDVLPGSWPMRFARFVKMSLQSPPEPSRRDRKFLANMVEKTPYADASLRRFGLNTLFDTDFEKQDEAKTLNEVIAHSLGFKVAHISRLEMYSLFAISYGIEYRWPLLDRDLIQQYFHTPAIQKRKGLLGRYLHRKGVEGLIPEEVAMMPGKDMGRPIGEGLNIPKQSLKSFAEIPQDLKALLDKGAVEKLISDVRNGENQQDAKLQVQRLILYNIETVSRWFGR